MWHEKILDGQGFLNDRIAQYTHLKDIASGSFGQVSLVEHRYSKVKLAMKRIKKDDVCNLLDGIESFKELDLMKEVC